MLQPLSLHNLCRALATNSRSFPFADDWVVVELQQVLNCVNDLSNPAVPVDLNRQAELVVLIENVQKSH